MVERNIQLIIFRIMAIDKINFVESRIGSDDKNTTQGQFSTCFNVIWYLLRIISMCLISLTGLFDKELETTNKGINCHVELRIQRGNRWLATQRTSHSFAIKHMRNSILMTTKTKHNKMQTANSAQNCQKVMITVTMTPYKKNYFAGIDKNNA